MKQVHAYPRAHERGVSLIEMTIVLGLISIMALVTIPNFMSMYQNSRVKATARSMITDMRNARQLAISSNTRTRIAFKTGPTIHEYEVFREKKDRLTGASTWDRVKYGNLGIVVFIESTNFNDTITGDGGLKDAVFLPNGTLQATPSATPYHVTIKTDQRVSKPIYRLEFTLSGNVALK